MADPSAGGHRRPTLADFDLFALPAAYYDDPAPWLKMLRNESPIHVNDDGSHLLTRYDDVRTVWRDLSGLVDKRAAFETKFGAGPLLEHHTTGMLFRDPPDHDRLRALVNPFFAPASIARLAAAIGARVDAMLADLAGRSDIDFVRDFAARLPIFVICRILGVSPDDGKTIRELGGRILYPLNTGASRDDIRIGHAAAAEFKDYLRPFVDKARRDADLDATRDIVSAMVAAERNGSDVSETEILHMCILMLNGGHETTTNLMAVGLNALLQQRDQIEILRDEPDAVPAAIEELIRFVSPLQLQGRRTTKPVDVPSGRIPADTEVILCQASANRDERMFERPDRLDLRRQSNAHVAFGSGIHLCIGRPLARLEASIALPLFLQRFRHIERAGAPRFNRNARFRGLASLPLRIR